MFQRVLPSGPVGFASEPRELIYAEVHSAVSPLKIAPTSCDARAVSKIYEKDDSRNDPAATSAITPKLDGLPHNKGPKGAMRYNSALALERIYAADSEKVALDQAHAEQALTQARLNRTRDEVLRKERIPLELVLSIYDQTLQAMSATLKAAKDKVLTVELLNDIFEDFRKIPDKLNW
jgi:hypothetical protein